MKNKIFSTVNVFGLAIGMAACFFIFLFVHFELSYDKFHKNVDNLYRVPLEFSGSLASNGMQATNHPAVGPALKQTFPEVVDYARLVQLSTFSNTSMVSYTEGDKTTTFNEDRIYLADPSFLTMFSFPFVSGDPNKALSDLKDLVISASTAKKYFGRENPLGKTLSLNHQMSFRVTGVFRDVPENSHVKFDMLASIGVMGMDFMRTEWTWPEFYTYVLLAPGTDPHRLEAKFPAFIQEHLGDKMKQLNYGCSMHLQPLKDIHLRSNYSKEAEPNGSENEIYFLSIIGIFILVIAWINYINLSTAKSVERAKEVGLRKVVGALKIQLIVQFITESVIINLLAVGVASVIVWVCYPFFGRFIGKDMHDGLSSSGLIGQPVFWLGLGIAFIISAFLVGAYPAFVLSAFRPVLVLKGRLFQSARGIVLRKTMVSFQFLLSILLIAGAITVYSQLSFMQKQALGYNKDQILVMKAPAIFDSTIADKMGAFKNEVLSNPAVSDIGVSTEIPGKTIAERNTVRKISEDETHNFTPFFLGVDDHFIPTYQMEISAGRKFSPEDSSQVSDKVTTKVMVNEALVKGLGYKDDQAAIGQAIVFRYGQRYMNANIIGVVKNYHQRSLREGYDPIMYYYPSYNAWSYISIRLNSGHLSQDIASFEKAYKNIFKGNAVEYFFLDDYFNQQYQADQRFGKVFNLFTGLTIFVACLGLLGLSSFVIKLRTKEIGIRKVLGASIYSLLVLFSIDFIQLVCLASVIALPMIYFMASRWLDNYAFHIHLSWIIFVMPPLLLLIISLFTISLHSVRAALANPVKSLKTE